MPRVPALRSRILSYLRSRARDAKADMVRLKRAGLPCTEKQIEWTVYREAVAAIKGWRE